MFLVFVYVCASFCVCVQVQALRRATDVLTTVPDQETEETQPYAPKAGASSQVWEQRGTKKKIQEMKQEGTMSVSCATLKNVACSVCQSVIFVIFLWKFITYTIFFL
jgi:hypothetical protein